MAGQDEGSERQLSTGRKLAFALVTAAAILAGTNALVSWLGRRGVLDLHRPDDRVQFVEEALFEPGPDGTMRTTRYAEESMVPGSFRAERGDGFRLFVLGGSFAMGSPYSHQEDGDESPGGIASWLRARLTARSDGPVEVVNLGAGGEGSFRVKRVLEDTLPHEPSAVFVATCNNEGAAQPSAMREYLHTLGGYRLMTKLLAPTEDLDASRELHTVQEEVVVTLRNDFRQNLQEMVRASGEAGVPLLLATVPVNLRYTNYSMSAFADGVDITTRITREEPDECVAKGRAAYEEERWSDAVTLLAECEDVAEALRWTGLALIELGEVRRAKAALEQSVELLPRNRCRPSFNAVIREVAAAAPEHVHLVDLQRASEEAAPDGIPGYDQFLDYCHMHWRGYAAMAAEIEAVLDAAGLLPPGDPGRVPPLEELARQLDVARMDGLGRVEAAKWR